MITLWVATAYLVKHSKYKFASLITAIPAAFMTAVTVTYIFVAQEGFHIPVVPAYIIGGVATICMVGIYVFFIIKLRLKHKNIEPLNDQDVTIITND